MTDSKPEGGTNARPLNDTIAGTGPGIADDAQTPGQEQAEAPDEEEAERIARRLGVELKPD